MAEENKNKNCEECFAPYMDDRKKITFQGMEFCNINCFMNSRYFDIDEVEDYSTLKTENEELLEDFKKSEDDKATAEAANKQIVDALAELLKKYDSTYESKNSELDMILDELTKIIEESTI